MPDVDETHATVTRYMQPWREWRSECPCGWTGSYVATESAARAEAVEHVRTEAGA